VYSKPSECFGLWQPRHALERGVGLRHLIAARLPVADHVAAHALGSAVGAVTDERVEGRRMVGELPGRSLGRVANRADFVSAVAGLVQQQGNALSRKLGESHPHQRRVTLA